MPATRDRLLREVITRAVTSPPALFFGAFGGIMALSPSPWGLGVGILSFSAGVGYVWWRVRDPNHARASGEDLLRIRWRDLISRLEALSMVLDRETAAALSAIVDSQERLLNLHGSERVLVPHTRMELTTLLQRCLSLAEKRHQLQTYTAGFRIDDVLAQIDELRARARTSHDDATRVLYQEAADHKEAEIVNYRRLQEAIDRIDGQLVVVQCTFDNVLSQVVRMRHADEVVRQEMESDPVFAEINQLTTRVAELDSSLNETLTVGARLE